MSSSMMFIKGIIDCPEVPLTPPMIDSGTPLIAPIGGLSTYIKAN